MVKGKKVPQAAINRADTKNVRFQETTVSDRPSWRFSTVDLAGPFSWPKGKDQELKILEKLHHFDSMKWHEIEGDDHHLIGLEALSKEAVKRLTEIHQDDVDEVFSFHFSGRPRIIGIRDRGIVKLLWWDPNHQVCPSKKKGT